MLSSLSTDRGGMEKGWLSTASCSDRGGGDVLELIHIGGALASTSYAGMAARFQPPVRRPCIDSVAGCSKPLYYEVIRSPGLEVDCGCGSSPKGGSEQQALVPRR
jgi:hypothetical protein